MGEPDIPRRRRALLLIDFINPQDFPEAHALALPALEAARHARRLARAARARAIPVIYANDNFGRWRSDCLTMVKRLGEGQDARTALAGLLRHQRIDLTLLKPVHCAFFGTPLGIRLDQMGARSVVLAGLAADIRTQHWAYPTRGSVLDPVTSRPSP